MKKILILAVFVSSLPWVNHPWVNHPWVDHPWVDHPSLLSAYEKAENSFTKEIGPGMKITITFSPSEKTIPQAIKQAVHEGRRVYKMMEGSSSGDIGAINKNAGKKKVKVSDDFLRLFRVLIQIYEATEGRFDIVKSKGDSPKAGANIKDPSLEVNFNTSEATLPDPGTMLDFRGIREGYALDRMSGSLKSAGLLNFKIETEKIFRTLGHNGNRAWRIDVKDPSDIQKTLCQVSLESGSLVSVSADDVRSAMRNVGSDTASFGDLRGITIVSPNATEAKVLADTGLLIGKEKARAMYEKIKKPGFGAILEDQFGKVSSMGDITAVCFE